VLGIIAIFNPYACVGDMAFVMPFLAMHQHTMAGLRMKFWIFGGMTVTSLMLPLMK
jgi:hypothetical protein